MKIKKLTASVHQYPVYLPIFNMHTMAGCMNGMQTNFDVITKV